MALIFTPTLAEKNWTTIKAHERNVGVITPLSLAYVAAVAEKAGHQAMIIDSVAGRLSVEEVVAELKAFSPDLLGFTMTTYVFYQTLSWIKILKEKTGLPVLIGGQHLGTYPKETMTHSEIDYAVLGEAEITLPKLLRALETGSSLRQVKGIAYRQKNRVVFTSPQDRVVPIDQVPFPARHLLDNSLYYNLVSRRKNFTPMVTARGCPFRCIFCDLKKAKFRMRSPKNLVDEIEECHRDYKVREIDFYDSSFTVDKNRVLAICQEIRKRKLDIDWSARTRVDCVDKEMLRELAKAGCVRIMYGIESADPKILKTLRKGIDLERIKKVIGWNKEYGMEALGFFMIGSPGETQATAARTIKFACELPLDWVQFTKTTPFPATELYQMFLDDGGGDYWRRFVLDPKHEKPLPMVRTKLTQAEAQQLIRKAYLAFFLRPQKIWASLKKMRSVGDFYRSVRAMIDMIFLPPVEDDFLTGST